MKKTLKNLILWICTGVVILLIPILYSKDAPIEVSAPHLNQQEMEEQEKAQQAEQARALEALRRQRVYSCKRSDDCIIVDKDPCGCLVGPQGVTAINAFYTADFDLLQAKTVTKACPDNPPSKVRECAPTARAACVKSKCKIVY